MGWTTIQTADEAARAMLTHRCRYRPGLKLRPEHCESYMGKVKSNPFHVGATLALQCREWNCPGPVEIETEPSEKPMETEMRVSRNKAIGTPTTCRTCGLEFGAKRPDGSEVAFYPSRADQCIECIKARVRARKHRIAGGKPASQAEAHPATTEIQTVQPESAPEHSYNCDLHGPHNGTMQGRYLLDACPVCAKEKRIGALRDHNAKTRSIHAAFDRFPFLADWLDDQIREQGSECSRYELMAQMIVQGIPAEWFKQWALRGRAK